MKYNRERYLQRKARLHASGVTSNGKPWAKKKTPEQQLHDDKRRFWASVDKSGKCWIWTKGLNRQGYGKFKAGGKTIGAHRAIFQWTYGILPIGSLACHKCDNPSCVRPSHLFRGTPLTNMLDKVHKGRQARGPKHANAIRQGAAKAQEKAK